MFSALDDARGVAHDVRREQDVVEDALLEPGAQRLDGHRALVADDAADAREAEPEGEVDGREVGGLDQQQQREAGAAVGQLGGDEPDRLQRDALEVELQDAGVLAAGRVAEEVAATRDDLSVDQQADPARRLEPDRRCGARVGDGDLEPEPIDARRERAELEGGTDRRLEAGAALRHAGSAGQLEVQLLEPDRTGCPVDRHGDLQAAPAFEEQPRRRCEGDADAELERHADAAVGDEPLHEAVTVRLLDDQRALPRQHLDLDAVVGDHQADGDRPELDARAEDADHHGLLRRGVDRGQREADLLAAEQLVAGQRAVGGRGVAERDGRAARTGRRRRGVLGVDVDGVPHEDVDDPRRGALRVQLPDRAEVDLQVHRPVDGDEQPGSAGVARHPGQRRPDGPLDGGPDIETAERERQHRLGQVVAERRRRPDAPVPAVQHAVGGQLDVGAEELQALPRREVPVRQQDGEREERLVGEGPGAGVVLGGRVDATEVVERRFEQRQQVVEDVGRDDLVGHRVEARRHAVLDDAEQLGGEEHRRPAQPDVLGPGQRQELAQDLLDDGVLAGAGGVDERLDRLDDDEDVLPHGEERLLVDVGVGAVGVDARHPFAVDGERRRRGRVESEVGEHRPARRLARERLLQPAEVPAEPAGRPLDEVAGAHAGGPIVGRTSGGSAVAGASTMVWDV